MLKMISWCVAWLHVRVLGIGENPLKFFARVMYRNGWYRLSSISYPVGYRIKFAGLIWETEEELQEVLRHLIEVGFFEVHREDTNLVRLNPLIRA